VGQFDERLQQASHELFGDWKSASHFERVPESYKKVDAIDRKIETARQGELDCSAPA